MLNKHNTRTLSVKINRKMEGDNNIVKPLLKLNSGVVNQFRGNFKVVTEHINKY